MNIEDILDGKLTGDVNLKLEVTTKIGRAHV